MKKHLVISLFLVLGLTMAQADNIFTEDLGLNIPLDSAAVDSEGDELEELDDIDVKEVSCRSVWPASSRTTP